MRYMNENFVIWPYMANLNPESHSLFPNAEKACNRFHKNEYPSSERSNRKIYLLFRRDSTSRKKKKSLIIIVL